MNPALTDAFVTWWFMYDMRPWWRFHPETGRLPRVIMPDRWGEHLPFTALRFPG